MGIQTLRNALRRVYHRCRHIAAASLLALGSPRLQGIAGGAGCSVCQLRLFTNFRWRRSVTAIDETVAQQVARSVPGVLRDAGGARAFAIVVAVHQRGVFGWDEWAAMLGEEIKAARRAGDPDSGETHYC